jgi:hypothetical protein
MKEGDGKKLAEARLKLPIFPGKDDVFTNMGQLFIDAYDELVRAMEILKVRQSDYVGARQDDVDKMLVRYNEVIREYQEMLFAEPAETEPNKTLELATDFYDMIMRMQRGEQGLDQQILELQRRYSAIIRQRNEQTFVESDKRKEASKDGMG